MSNGATSTMTTEQPTAAELELAGLRVQLAEAVARAEQTEQLHDALLVRVYDAADLLAGAESLKRLDGDVKAAADIVEAQRLLAHRDLKPDPASAEPDRRDPPPGYGVVQLGPTRWAWGPWLPNREEPSLVEGNLFSRSGAVDRCWSHSERVTAPVAAAERERDKARAACKRMRECIAMQRHSLRRFKQRWATALGLDGKERFGFELANATAEAVAAARADGLEQGLRDGLRRAAAAVLNAGIVTDPGQQAGVIFCVPMAERLEALAASPVSTETAPEPSAGRCPGCRWEVAASEAALGLSGRAWHPDCLRQHRAAVNHEPAAHPQPEPPPEMLPLLQQAVEASAKTAARPVKEWAADLARCGVHEDGSTLRHFHNSATPLQRGPGLLEWLEERASSAALTASKARDEGENEEGSWWGSRARAFEEAAERARAIPAAPKGPSTLDDFLTQHLDYVEGMRATPPCMGAMSDADRLTAKGWLQSLADARPAVPPRHVCVVLYEAARVLLAMDWDGFVNRYHGAGDINYSTVRDAVRAAEPLLAAPGAQPEGGAQAPYEPVELHWEDEAGDPRLGLFDNRANAEAYARRHNVEHPTIVPVRKAPLLDERERKAFNLAQLEVVRLRKENGNLRCQLEAALSKASFGPEPRWTIQVWDGADNGWAYRVVGFDRGVLVRDQVAADYEDVEALVHGTLGDPPRPAPQGGARHRVLGRVVAIEDDRAYCLLVLLGYPRLAWALPLATLGPQVHVGFRFFCRVTLPRDHEPAEIEDFEPGDFELDHDQRLAYPFPSSATHAALKGVGESSEQASWVCSAGMRDGRHYLSIPREHVDFAVGPTDRYGERKLRVKITLAEAAAPEGGDELPSEPLLDAMLEQERRYPPSKAPEGEQADEHKPHLGPNRCHADRDGDCSWKQCPQLRDRKSHCPLDHWDDEDDEDDNQSGGPNT